VHNVATEYASDPDHNSADALGLSATYRSRKSTELSLGQKQAIRIRKVGVTLHAIEFLVRREVI